jgi:hypothetical protein
LEDYELDLNMVDMYGASCVAPSPRDRTPAAIPKIPLQTSALPRPSLNDVEHFGVFYERETVLEASVLTTPIVCTSAASATSSLSRSIIPPLNLALPTGESWTEPHGGQPDLLFGYRPSEAFQDH